MNVSNFPLVDPGGDAFFKSNNGSAFIARFDENEVLTWSTMFATDGSDVINDVAVDGDGNIAVLGQSSEFYSNQFDFANEGSGFSDQSYNGGTWDAFAAKFNSDLELYWSTYVGGDANDIGTSLAVDNNGAIYICGETHSTGSSLPLEDGGGLHNDVTENGDAFVGKFSSSGVKEWLTLFGGSMKDRATAMAVSGNGHIYVVGETYSEDLDLETLPTAFNSDHNIIPFETNSDAFLLCVDSDYDPVWVTYFGGWGNGAATSHWDIPRDLALSPDGSNMIMVGSSNSAIAFPWVDPGNGAHYVDYLYDYSRVGFISKFEIGSLLSVDDFGNQEDDHGFIVFPNPNSGDFSLYVNYLSQPVKGIRIISSLGKTVYEENYSVILTEPRIFTVSLGKTVSHGMYQLQMFIGNDVKTKPMVLLPH